MTENLSKSKCQHLQSPSVVYKIFWPTTLTVKSTYFKLKRVANKDLPSEKELILYSKMNLQERRFTPSYSVGFILRG